MAEGAEVAVRPLARWAIGFFLRKVSKLLCEFVAFQTLQLCVKRVNLFLGGLDVFLVVSLDEDVRRTHLFGRGALRLPRHVGEYLVVLALDFLWIDDDLGREFPFNELLDKNGIPEFRACAFHAKRMLRQQIFKRGRRPRTPLRGLDDFVRLRHDIVVRGDNTLLGGLFLQQGFRDELLLEVLGQVLFGRLQLPGGNTRLVRLDELRHISLKVGAHEFGVSNRHNHRICSGRGCRRGFRGLSRTCQGRKGRTRNQCTFHFHSFSFLLVLEG